MAAANSPLDYRQDARSQPRLRCRPMAIEKLARRSGTVPIVSFIDYLLQTFDFHTFSGKSGVPGVIAMSCTETMSCSHQPRHQGLGGARRSRQRVCPLVARANESLLLSQTNEATHGTKRIPTEAMFPLKVALPALPEQTAIAAVLSDMDAEITALEQRRDKTRLLKQGMMHELLTGRTHLV